MKYGGKGKGKGGKKGMSGKIRCLLVVVALLFLAPTVDAQQPAATTPVSYESITIDATAGGKAFTASTITTFTGQVRVCAGRLETAEVRFRVDGLGAVTAAEGTPLAVGEYIEITGFAALSNFRAIRTGGVSGVIKFTCYR